MVRVIKRDRLAHLCHTRQVSNDIVNSRWGVLSESAYRSQGMKYKQRNHLRIAAVGQRAEELALSRPSHRSLSIRSSPLCVKKVYSKLQHYNIAGLQWVTVAPPSTRCISTEGMSDQGLHWVAEKCYWLLYDHNLPTEHEAHPKPQAANTM